jgi:hypothetical protein
MSENDPFYLPPQGYAATTDGSVLRARPITATALGVPLPASAWQLLYKSEDGAGQATAEAVTVMVPRAAWTGSGQRPLVSYQTAEDSVDARCSPSHALRTRPSALTSNAAAETLVIGSLLARGWAVAESQFLAGPQEGHAVLDGLRAASSFEPDKLGGGNPTALWGYSGGAFATAWAVQQQARYAPERRFAGIALGGVPADLEVTMRQADGGYGSGLVMGGLIGLQRAYPRSGIQKLLTPKGVRALAAGAHDCTDALIARYAFTPLRSYTASHRPFSEPALRRVLAKNSPLGKGAPVAPVYDYHAATDELVPVAVDDALVAQYCRAGVAVQRVRYPVGEHVAMEVTGAPGAENFLAARFAGAPSRDNCAQSNTPRERVRS